MSIATQLEYLKKIYSKQASAKDVASYVFLLFKDNNFNFTSLPSLSFTDMKDKQGEYDRKKNKINISKQKVYYVVNYPFSIVDLIDTVGHELRHYIQHAIVTDPNYDKIKKNSMDTYYELIKKSQSDKYKIDGYSSNFLKYAEKDFEYAIKEIIDPLQSIPHLKEWLYKNKNNALLKSNITLSYYLQHAVEEDARYGGILYVRELLDTYKNYLKDNPDNELEKIIESMTNESKKFVHNFNDNQEMYTHYQEFKHVIEDISVDSVKELSNLVTKNPKLLNNAFYTSFLDFQINTLISKSSPEELELMFFSKMYSYLVPLGKDRDTNASMSQYYETRILSQIANTNLPDEKKKQFTDYLIDNLIANYKKRDFDTKDNFITYLYAKNLISERKYKKFVNKLYKDNRVIEVSKILSFNDIPNKELNNGCYSTINACIEERYKVLTKSVGKVLKSQAISNETINSYIAEFKDLKNQIFDLQFVIPVNKLKTLEKKLNSFSKNSMEIIKSLRSKLEENTEELNTSKKR